MADSWVRVKYRNCMKCGKEIQLIANTERGICDRCECCSNYVSANEYKKVVAENQILKARIHRLENPEETV